MEEKRLRDEITEGKKGKPEYRILRVDEPLSPESQEAIEFMNSLDVAFTIQRIPVDIIKPATKLPCVWVNGYYFEGLEQIKKWKQEFDHLFIGEMDWLFSKEFLEKEQAKARGYAP